MSAPPAIMVTAVGALIGQGILRSLLSTGPGHRLIGIDRSDNAYGASLCAAFHRKPCIETDPAYLPWLLSTIEREHVALILPGIEEDVFFFHDHREQMRTWPVRIALNSPAAIAAGRDKWHLHETLTRHGFPTIPTALPHDWTGLREQLGQPPFLAKPRRGSGSRRQSVFRGEHEWAAARHEFGADFIVQKLVGTDDEEYTVGLFGYGDGAGSQPCTLHRRLWNGGTWQAELIDTDCQLAAQCDSLNRIFQPLGPTNYQFRREGSRWLLLEINPRISAATAIRAGFGFNDAQLCLEHYLQGLARPQPGRLRPGRCQRYVTEHFEFA